MLDNVINILSDLGIYSRSISGFGINDIVDILIIAYIIYKLMIWVKETRAWSLLKGFLVIFAISVASYVCKLYTVSWIINNTFNVGLIALIVIFQPELRKALEQIGKGKFISTITLSNQYSEKISVKTKEEIIRAVLTMSKEKTGALLLIEQQISLEDYESTGLKIDANVTSQLLMNIFEDKTPLHDGAVVIKNDRIAAAMCILPLTQVDIDKELGTRHRAALGVSEVTDAIVIVVSEETGDYSIAYNSELNRKLSESDLREFLSVNSDEEKKWQSPIWKGRS